MQRWVVASGEPLIRVSCNGSTSKGAARSPSPVERTLRGWAGGWAKCDESASLGASPPTEREGSGTIRSPIALGKLIEQRSPGSGAALYGEVLAAMNHGS